MQPHVARSLNQYLGKGYAFGLLVLALESSKAWVRIKSNEGSWFNHFITEIDDSELRRTIYGHM